MFFRILFLFVLQITGNFSCLTSYEYDGEVWECSSRYAFPTTCKNHFDDSATTVESWVEADNGSTILSFVPYLELIPRCYEADCNSCFDCGGVGFNLYRGFDDPIGDPFSPLRNPHTKIGGGKKQNCRNDSDHCEELCWNGGYFRKWNSKYIHFFRHFLEYLSENDECACYWPEIDEEAANINKITYDLLKDLADGDMLSPDYSPLWKATSYFYYYGQKTDPVEYFPNSHGMASSLATYTFFYSQYHQMLLSVIGFIDSNDVLGNTEVTDSIYQRLEEIRDEFSYKYNRCLRSHPHPKIYYERGMLKMHSGNFEGALTDINRMMCLNNADMPLTASMYQQEGQIYNELGMYDLAIEALTKAIKLDPHNRGAYFNRAEAYFETGEFESSLKDYISSNTNETSYSTRLKPPLDVKESILSGLLEGGKESAIEFIPSLCKSAYGLGTCLWAFIEHPIHSSNNMMNACYDISCNISDFFMETDFSDEKLYIEEFQKVQGKLDRLSDSEKAHLIGYCIGKYSVDIFSGGAAVKTVALCKNLKNANQLANFEALAISEKPGEAVKAAALAHAAKRDAFLKKVTINWDKQNKHVFGKHNFKLDGGIIKVDPNELELLVKQYAGTGQKIVGELGIQGYKERVDFGRYIGDYALKKEGQPVRYFPTTKGIITYAKDGTVHVYPSTPNGFIE